MGRALAQVLDVRVGHRIEPAPAFGFVDVDERLGVIERGLAEEHRVSHAEDRRICADADRQRQHGHRREARMAAQRAQAVADVAREILDGGGTELVPRPLSHLFHAAESDQRLPPRFVRRHAGAPVLLGLLLDMEADLVIEPILEFRRPAERTEPPQHVSERTHQSLSVHGRDVENEVDRARHASPLRQRLVQVPPPGRSQRVVARAAVVVGDAPLGADELLPLQAIERRVERPLPELQHVLRPLLDAFGDAPAVHRLELQGSQDQHVERSLQHVASVLRHTGSFRLTKGV